MKADFDWRSILRLVASVQAMPATPLSSLTQIDNDSVFVKGGHGRGHMGRGNRGRHLVGHAAAIAAGGKVLEAVSDHRSPPVLARRALRVIQWRRGTR